MQSRLSAISFIWPLYLTESPSTQSSAGAVLVFRGMRIRVSDVLDLFAAGLDAAQILDEMPDLEADDLKACLTYARRRIDHPLLAA